MKKRIKVFQAGNYPQGNFDETRVNKIFSEVKTTEGIYAHTSKWLEKGEKPLNIGEFSNFTIENGVVMADCEFNEKGQSYYNDGVIRGVSVEIQGDNLGKIALLPIGVKPAIAGAEFEEEDGAFLNFEEIEEKGGQELNLTAILEAIKTMSLDDRTAIINAVFGSLTNDEKEGIRQLYWADFEKKEPKKVKTEAEIRAEVVKEFELKEKGNQLKSKMKTKIIPALQPLVEFAIDKALVDTQLIEFEEENGKKINISQFEKIEKNINSLPNATNFNSETKKEEFEFEEEENVIEKTKNEIKAMIGGKK